MKTWIELLFYAFCSVYFSFELKRNTERFQETENRRYHWLKILDIIIIVGSILLVIFCIIELLHRT